VDVVNSDKSTETVSAATSIKVPAPTFKVTAPVVPPPVKPSPAVTPVISPTLIEPPSDTPVPLIVIEELSKAEFGNSR
jgi:hypothetical protein